RMHADSFPGPWKYCASSADRRNPLSKGPDDRLRRGKSRNHRPFQVSPWKSTDVRISHTNPRARDDECSHSVAPLVARGRLGERQRLPEGWERAGRTEGADGRAATQAVNCDRFRRSSFRKMCSRCLATVSLAIVNWAATCSFVSPLPTSDATSDSRRVSSSQG